MIKTEREKFEALIEGMAIGDERRFSFTEPFTLWDTPLPPGNYSLRMVMDETTGKPKIAWQRER